MKTKQILTKIYFSCLMGIVSFSAYAQYEGGSGRGDASGGLSGSYLANTWKTTGGTSDFSNPTNWTDGNVPLANQNSIIPSGGTQPNITTDFVLPTGATLEIMNSAVLTINSTIKFTVNPTAALCINGSLVNNGQVTLKSDATGTAFIRQSAGSVTGNITVEQYIPGSRKYRLLAHPFGSTQNLSIISDNIDITGNVDGITSTTAKTVGAGFVSTPTNNPSAYRFSTADANGSTVDGGWKAFTAGDGSGSNNNWAPGQGIRLLIRGTKGQGLDGSSYTPDPVTIDMTGSINIGDVNVNLLTGGSGATSGFNLIGNPYASPIDISSVVYTSSGATDINKTIYLRNPQTGQWINTTLIEGIPYSMPAYSAVLIRNIGSSNITLPFTESKKTSASTLTVFKKSVQPSRLILKCMIGGIEFDNLNLLFDDQNNALFEDKYDALKLGNDSFNFNAVTADNIHVCTQVLPINNQMEIPLFTNIRSGSTQIEVGVSQLDVRGYDLYFKDKLLNKETLIDSNFKYLFSIDAKNASTFGLNRFSIAARKSALSQPEVKGVKHFVLYPNPATTAINLKLLTEMEGIYDMKVYNQLGQEIKTQQFHFSNGNHHEINIEDLDRGLYYIKLSSGNSSQTISFIK